MKRWLIVLGVLAGLGLMAYGLAYACVLRGLPPISDLDAGLALPSTRIYDRDMRLLYEIAPDGIARNTVLPFEVVPPHCVDALIATEDAAYYRHPGVSARGIARALWLNLRGRDVIAGGSTITQQVARNLLLDPHARAERTLRRKLREAVLALRLQQSYSKDEVLALWLNQTDFGNLAYGIEAAAQAYFRVPASSLSLAECALLIGIPQSPPTYDPLTNLDNAKARQETVLRLMVENNMLTQEQADLAATEPLQFAASPYPIQAPHAVLEVWRQIEADYPDALYGTGLEVVTTIDLDLHNRTRTIVQRELALLNDRDTGNRVPVEADNAAVVVMDPRTGEVLTMLGSPNYFDEAISGAMDLTQVPRQPGSTLKPFTYAALMDPTRFDPWTASQMIVDVRTPFVTRRLESYVPANFDLEEHGPVSLRVALASSYNIPAVIALERIGVQPFIQFMTDLGVEKLSENPDVDLSVTLGGGEVRLLNLTAAYGTLANGGYRVQPTLIQRVSTPNGEVLYEHRSPAPIQVMDKRVAFLITDILSDDRARVPSFGRNSLLSIGRPAAAKTGTTTDFRDNWVVGYTPELVVGVWVGNADYTPMVSATGLTGAGPIWHHVMRDALKNTPESVFSVPDGIVQVDVCVPSGLLPTDACPNTQREWFIDGDCPDRG
jgi:penicillin-binding protein 1C